MQGRVSPGVLLLLVAAGLLVTGLLWLGFSDPRTAEGPSRGAAPLAEAPAERSPVAPVTNSAGSAAEKVAALDSPIELSGRPENPEARAAYEEGLRALEAGDGEAALAAFLRAAELDPQNATYFSAAGDIARELGRYAEAEEYYRQALELVEDEYGRQSPQVASVMRNLGAVQFARGDFEAAYESFNLAMSIEKLNFGNVSPRVARTLRDLASVERALGNLAEAEALLAHALDIDSILDITQTVHGARTLEAMGKLLLDQGRVGEAAPLLQQMQEILSSIFEPDDPRSAPYYRVLAELAAAQGDLDRARDLRNLGASLVADYPWLLEPHVREIGGEAAANGDFREAREIFQETLERNQELYGVAHPKISMTLTAIADTYASERKFGKAIPYYEDALAVENVLGGEHPRKAKIEEKLAKVHYYRERQLTRSQQQP